MPKELDSENYWPDNNSNSCAQTQKELEYYGLQELADDPYRFELEDVLTRQLLQKSKMRKQRSIDKAFHLSWMK